ncbi:neurotrypsin-like [Mya arenaria]|uniref:neurotrypsin-like n=1 Tax=Mya arenaria TaxID=6604 RepID=UPI0022E56A0C|nr:neurotrypsin-like [Mya arenaria]
MVIQAIRLVDGPNTYEGRIETSINGSLVTLCDHFFDIKASNVACIMLGYSGAKEVISSTRYGVGQMPLYTGRISCNGNEKSLEQCDLETNEDSPCNNQRIVGVICKGGPMKLEPFANKPYEGVFTTSQYGKWYRFTGNISDITTKTLCNMTGFRQVSDYDYNIEDVRFKQLRAATPNQGVLELFIDGELGTPSVELGMVEAQIICKHFGYL